MEGDIASQLVDGVDKFLLRQIEASVDDARAALETRLLLRRGLQQIDRAEPAAAGAHFWVCAMRAFRLMGRSSLAPRRGPPWWAKALALKCLPSAGRHLAM